MTELATREGFAPAAATGFSGFAPQASHLPARQQSDQFVRMGKWLDLFMATEQVAQVLARTQFVPEPMRGQPENIAAAMMKSLELGIDPLDGLAAMHVVKGKIGFAAEFMRRRILEAGHEFVIDESTDSRCKIRGRRSGSNDWQTVVFTEEQARKAKIDLGNYPADKLVARASSRLCKRVFPDVLAGALIIDDLEDGDVAGEASIEDTKRTVQRKRQPRAVKAASPKPDVSDVDELLDDEPAAESDIPSRNSTPNVANGTEQDDLLDDEPAREDPPADEPEEPATAPQNKKMHAVFREVGLTDRGERLTVTSAILGYPISTSSGLTKSEAVKLIDTLEAWITDGQAEGQINEILNAAALAADN